jgi:hypothetical protein
VVSDTEIVIDDLYHADHLRKEHDSSVNWTDDIRHCFNMSSPIIQMNDIFADNIRIFITAYAPSIKRNQELKLIVEENGNEIFLDSSGFPWFSTFFDVYEKTFPISYKFSAVFTDGSERIGNEIYRPRILLDSQRFIKSDNWIVRPFG